MYYLNNSPFVQMQYAYGKGRGHPPGHHHPQDVGHRDPREVGDVGAGHKPAYKHQQQREYRRVYLLFISWKKEEKTVAAESPK